MSSRDDVADRMRAQWGSMAELYVEAIEPALAPLHDAVLDLTGQVRDRDVLDLGCGTGVLSARLVLAGARVSAVDLAPEMVEVARARLEGVPARVAVMDAEALELPDAGFDVVVACCSLMFCAEPGRALAEARRVLRPGGRLAAAVWGHAEECQTARVAAAAAELFSGPRPEPTPHSLGDRDRLAALLAGAGFGEVELTTRDVDLWYPSEEAFVRVARHLYGAVVPPALLDRAAVLWSAELAEVGLPLRNRAHLVCASR